MDPLAVRRSYCGVIVEHKGRIEGLPHVDGRIGIVDGVRSLLDLHSLKMRASALRDLFEQFRYAASEIFVRFLAQVVFQQHRVTIL